MSTSEVLSNYEDPMSMERVLELIETSKRDNTKTIFYIGPGKRKPSRIFYIINYIEDGNVFMATRRTNKRNRDMHIKLSNFRIFFKWGKTFGNSKNNI